MTAKMPAAALARRRQLGGIGHAQERILRTIYHHIGWLTTLELAGGDKRKAVPIGISLRRLLRRGLLRRRRTLRVEGSPPNLPYEYMLTITGLVLVEEQLG